MRMNSKKLSSYHFDPTNSSLSRSIKDLNNNIANGVLSLPQYQRDISWNLQKMIDLFNYQLFGKAPISPLSLNELVTKSKSSPQIHLITRNPLDDQELSKVKWSVIDGQQRLTTNYMAFTNDDAVKNIVFDFGKAIFKENSEKPTDNQIPVGILLNKDDNILLEYLKNISDYDPTKHYTYIIDIKDKLQKYEYTMHVAEDMTEEEQLKWFEVLNNAGSRVSKLQLIFSRSKAYDFDIYTDYANKFKNIAANYGYQDLFTPFSTSLSYPVALLNPAFEKSKRIVHSNNYSPIPSDNKASQLSKLSADEMKSLSKNTLSGLITALDFISNNDLEDLIVRMDYILYLTGYFVWNDGIELKNDIEHKLVDWVSQTDFTNKTQSERRKIFSQLLEIN